MTAKQLVPILGLCLCIQQRTIAQTWEFIDSSIVTDASQITVDPLGNIYTVSAKQKLQKTNNIGQITAEFQDIRHGRIGTIDASNAMEVLVFYPDLQTLLLLDRNLIPISSVYLPNLGFSFVQAVCRSNDKGFWLFDGTTQQLKNCDPQGTINYLSDPMPSLIERTLHPTQITQNGTYVAILDSTQGIFIFDTFANIVTSSTCQTPYILGINNTELYALASTDSLYRISLADASSSKILLPIPAKMQQCVLSADMLYILQKDKVLRYRRQY